MQRAPRPLLGRVVAITGGARGIGLATARALAARGARVAIGDLDAALAQQAARDIGRGTLASRLDVTDERSFRAFLRQVESAHAPLDVLVNNAGVMHVGPFLDEPEDWIRRQVEINLLGVIHGMRLALPGMIARGDGHVVNVASAAARIGVKHEAVYAATKHAVAGLTESVRQELRGSGVQLSLVLPGLVRTELSVATTGAKRALVLEPRDVAEAIAGALERPRFDVFVPRSYGVLLRLLAPLPRAAREAVLRAFGSEVPARTATPEARAVYEERIAELYDQRKS